jgi:DNA-binding PadR family transcriptional regulator
MNVPLYILGLLRRFGPLHGYQIKKVISEEIADFANIKLPTVYYHVQRMEADGLLSASREKDSNRPERRVYSITAAGNQAFDEGLAGLLELEYAPTFDSDALLYFGDSFELSDIRDALDAHASFMLAALAALDAHASAALEHVPADKRTWASAIFDHHRKHYQVEASWARGLLSTLHAKEA